MNIIIKYIRRRLATLAVLISVMFILIVLFTFSLLINEKASSSSNEVIPIPINLPINLIQSVNKNFSTDSHRLAILVPFRDRFDELLIFAPYIKKFLNDQSVNHDIFILNQVDRYRFNRASLINVGYLLTNNTHDYIAMHDVDLLPLNPKLKYVYPKVQPYHIAAPHLHPRYHYPTFVGGILLVNREHFGKVNGMSNKYWGWGLEDDEFFVRLREVGLNITRPQDIGTDTTNTFKHIHDKSHRKRDSTKCYNQREVTRKRDRQTGLHNVNYQVIDIKKLTIDGAAVTVFNIQLNCDKKLTPWCICDEHSTGSGTNKNKNSVKT